jgi:hypothetical protein
MRSGVTGCAVIETSSVLPGLAVAAERAGGWWADPVVELAIAAAAWEGIQYWHG